MKISGVILSSLLAISLSTQAQLILNTGESWTYSFNELPLTGFVSSFNSTPGGTLQFTVGSAFPAGSRLQYELFENNTSEAPINSGVLSSVPPYGATCTQNGAWQDLQGEVRFTMLSGQATLSSLELQAIVAGPSLSQNEVHSTSLVPVPEPASVLLLGIGLGLAAISLRRQV